MIISSQSFRCPCGTAERRLVQQKLISEGYGWDDNEEADLINTAWAVLKLTFSKETAEAKSDVRDVPRA